jgi:hypothetical protein
MTKLAFWRTLSAAYGFTFARPARVVAAARIWLAGLAVLALALPWLTPQSPEPAGAAALAAALLQGVGWQRAILAGEAPATRLGRRELRFLGYALLVGVIAAALAATALMLVLPLAVVAPMLPKGFLIALVAKLIAFAVLGTVLARLALSFPALALDRRGDVLEQAWQDSRGNGVRLFAGLLLAGLPFVLAHQLMAELLGTSGWWTGHRAYALAPTAAIAQSLAGALLVVGSFLALAVATAFLALAYRQLAAGAAADGGMTPARALPAH